MKQKEKIEKLNCYETNNTIHTCNFPSKTAKMRAQNINIFNIKALASFASPTYFFIMVFKEDMDAALKL